MFASFAWLSRIVIGNHCSNPHLKTLGQESGSFPSPGPFQTLHQDVLSTIFVLSIPVFGCRNLMKNELPLNVSATCKAWRNAALSTPALWTKIQMIYKGERQDPWWNSRIVPGMLQALVNKSTRGHQQWYNRCMPEMLQVFVHRSQASPLSVAFESGENFLDPSSLDAIISLLLSCRDRWKSICIGVPAGVTRRLLCSDALPASMLKILLVHNGSPDPEGLIHVDAEVTFPALEFMTSCRPLLALKRPCMTLTTLSLWTDVNGSVLRVLKNLPSLLSLELGSHRIPNRFPGDKFQLNHLHTLELTFKQFSWETPLLPLFSQLIMPKLITLRLCFRYYPAAELLGAISVLLNLSKPSLRDLHLLIGNNLALPWHDEQTRSTMLDIFRRTTSLETLLLPPHLFDHHIVKALTFRQGSECILPSVELLTIVAEYHELGTMDYVECLREMIRSRHGLAPLTVKCFRISGRGALMELESGRNPDSNVLCKVTRL